ncbi:nudix-type nucleoside diphosphatase (YffH/AdpP family) [Lewinella antarctica]|uniref:GDP-mannose pyrophosphatase n=1 Tax=Neolewinella antarctica TaxID=442734 RepID=A0ABX0XDN9_9BACT|nr:nudix-type nucleoside diphosphatase (YffH/AdpP family) [Neolewinella antarctica]
MYNTVKRTIILTRQFRLPTYVNGNEGGFLVEACAGLLDGDNPLDCIKKEVIEETGYHVTKVEKIFEAYMSPGSVTEIIHFFIAKYDESLKKSDGGGVQEETEEIEILEMDFDDAMRRITSNEICDGKTIMLIYHLRVQGIL